MTDALRNIDLPASFYNLNREVNFPSLYASCLSFLTLSLLYFACIFCTGVLKVLLQRRFHIQEPQWASLVLLHSLQKLSFVQLFLNVKIPCLKMEPIYLRNVARAGTNDFQYNLPTDFKRRPGFNTTGKAIQVPVNSYAVTQFPTVKVYQYDVGQPVLLSNMQYTNIA